MRKKTKVIEYVCYVLILVILAMVTNQYFGFSGHLFSTAKAMADTDPIYSFLDEGDIKTADLCLQDSYTMPRYDPVKISSITWQEDPYEDAPFWRFNFYSLRFTGDLLYAWMETGNRAYNDKLLQIINSFLDSGMDKTHSWDDNSAVAFRTMVLTNTWVKLHERNALSGETNTKILEALKVHGDFLLDENHYEGKFNHAITEAAALLYLGTTFPDMPNSGKWISMAKNRLSNQLATLIDEDGVLVENSPYYHFYVLEFYRDINKYSIQHNITISDQFTNIITKMIDYGTYILQPNLEVPLLGASIYRKFYNSGQYQEMSSTDPYLLYVLTQGKQGKVPPNLNQYYPVAGQTVMRSGWGKGNDFERQTQIVFDVGNYRTNHSDLDALSFSLYSNGITLMPDSGLYTYAVEDPLKPYFHGTSAHNTVVVDGMDQNPYSATAGAFLEGEGYVCQSAEHELYNGVSHQRAMALLGHNLVLIVDNLISDKEHKYEQMFHLFPEAKLDTDGLTVTGSGLDPNQSITIYQLLPEGITVNLGKGQDSSPKGLYSAQYGVAIPNYAISYEQHGNTASFITLLEIGEHDKNLVAEVSPDQSSVNIRSNEGEYSINIAQSPGSERQVIVANNNKPVPEERIIENFENPEDWAKENNSGRGSISNYKTDNSVDGSILNLTSPDDGSYLGAVKRVSLDLSGKNILLRMKVSDTQAVNLLELSFSTNNWKGYVEMNLKNPYRVEFSDFENQWITISLGTGTQSNVSDHWVKYGSGFDWSNIDQVRFRIGAQEGKIATLQLNRLSTIPGQKEGVVIITFDDGHKSISSAVDIMNKYGFKANVAVITHYPRFGYYNNLSLEKLRELQDVYGWNIVNHSEHHKNALTEYWDNNDMAGLETDILKGAQYLIENGINSAPNWYVYPNGATNSEIKEIVGKYYKFARIDSGPTDVYPFGEPLGVRAYSVTDNMSPDKVKSLVLDAKENKLSLFLTFHRVKSSSAQTLGYDIKDFENVIAYIAEQGIKVETLSEFDKGNGFAFNQLTITDAIPEQIVPDVKINKIGLFQKMLNKISGH